MSALWPVTCTVCSTTWLARRNGEFCPLCGPRIRPLPPLPDADIEALINEIQATALRAQDAILRLRARLAAALPSDPVPAAPTEPTPAQERSDGEEA